MVKKGLIVPPGGGSILSMAPGRSAALKLLGGESGDSIMLFEETAPAGTETTFHLHRDSDEVAYVRGAKSPLRSATRLRSAGRAPVPSYPTCEARLEKYRCRNRTRAVSLYPGRCRRLFRGTAGAAGRVRPMDRRPTRCGRVSRRRLTTGQNPNKIDAVILESSHDLPGAAYSACGAGGVWAPAAGRHD